MDERAGCWGGGLPAGIFSGLALGARARRRLADAGGGYGRPLWWLQILSLAALAYALLAARSARQAAGQAWLFGTAWLTGTFWWLFISMHTYGGLAAPLAVAAVLALAAFLGSYYAVASWCFRRLTQTPSTLSAMVFAALWTLAELGRGWLWTGFPGARAAMPM